MLLRMPGTTLHSYYVPVSRDPDWPWRCSGCSGRCRVKPGNVDAAVPGSTAHQGSQSARLHVCTHSCVPTSTRLCACISACTDKQRYACASSCRQIGLVVLLSWMRAARPDTGWLDPSLGCLLARDRPGIKSWQRVACPNQVKTTVANRGWACLI